MKRSIIVLNGVSQIDAAAVLAQIHLPMPIKDDAGHTVGQVTRVWWQANGIHAEGDLNPDFLAKHEPPMRFDHTPPSPDFNCRCVYKPVRTIFGMVPWMFWLLLIVLLVAVLAPFLALAVRQILLP